MPTPTFPRETVEYLPLTTQVDGEDTDTYQVAVVPRNTRPTAWSAAPYLITGLTPGTYHVYVRVSDTPETPVVDVGPIVIT